MYAYKLKLGPATHTNDEVIYLGIHFVNGESTTLCSEREAEKFRQVGMDVILVPVESPEFTDLRDEIKKIRDEAAAYEAKLVEGFRKQIEVLEAAVQQTVNERDEARKQLSLNLELMELRNLHFNGTGVVNDKNPASAGRGQVSGKG